MLYLVIKPLSLKAAAKSGGVEQVTAKQAKAEELEAKMALQWMILTYVVAAEAALAFLLTIPAPNLLKNRFVWLVSLILRPALFIVPFAGFQLLDIYWKNEHRLACTSDVCTASERDRYEKSMYKAQGNVVLCASACLLYWCLFRICKLYKDIQNLEEVEKRYKDE